MKKFLIATFVAISFLVALSSGSLMAQSGNEEGENITIGPATIKPELIAGEEYKGSVRILNNGKTDYTFRMYAKPFSVEGETYQAEFETVNKFTEVYQWIHFDKSEYQLKSGANMTVSYTIKVPNDARPGGHYAVIFAETQPTQKESVARKKRVGSLVYATASGEYQRQGSVEGFESKSWYKKGPISSDIRIRNDGNVHFEATTDIVYKTLFGKAAYSDRQDRMIMPGTTRKVTASWQNVPLLGIYKLTGTVQYLDKTETLNSRYILVMPYWFILVIAVLLVALCVKIVISRKKRSLPDDKTNDENED